MSIWLLQNSGFQNKTLMEEIDALERLGIKYLVFDYMPFKGIDLSLETGNYVVRGGTKILESENDTVKSGMFYSEQKFNQAYYSKLNLPLLNHDNKIFKFDEIKNIKFDEDVFVKPSKDSKSFNAEIIVSGKTLGDILQKQTHESIEKDIEILVSSVKKIISEYRFFIVDGEVITGSRYRFLGQLNISSEIPDYMLKKAHDYAKLYAPSDVFTMDLAETKEGIFIVEYNCWNASGLYKTDVMKIFNAVNEYKDNIFENQNNIKI